jgi:hypothetical protein
MSDEDSGSSERRKVLVILALLACFAILLPIFSGGAPEGADSITSISSGRFDSNFSPASHMAQAGNVTQLLINATTVTRNWQGYYGNVSGRIVLDNGQNASIYSWELFPNGEVYAANHSSVDWDSIKCVNFTSNRSDGWSSNITNIESFFNINPSDRDGIDETFNSTYINSTGFFVGNKLIDTSNKCPLAHTFVSGNYQEEDFEELLLTDNVSLIFASILEIDSVGFDSRKWDFQMLVAEDGDNPAPTNYYFFVEVS